MNPVDSSSLSRRQWLERVSGSALAASLGAGLIGAPLAAAASQPTAPDPLRGARLYNVRDFGAKGDGQSIDTAAIQAAIDACHRDQGGTVLIPAGDFVSGTLELKSNLTLHLSAQGRLLGSPNKGDYHPGKDIPPSNGNVVFLGAAGCENLTIEGNGLIDGNGLKFWTGQGDNTGPGQNSAQGYFERPHLIVFSHCRNIRMRDVSLLASAYHCARILDCEQVNFDGVRIYNRVNKNNDGFHFNNCRYVHVINCDVKCQDDACALFGGNQWVTIANCTFSTRWSVFRFGGGVCTNITISDCVIYDTFGSPIKLSCRGGSRFENISFSNLILQNVTGPITIGLQSRRRTAAPVPPGATGTPPAPVTRGIVRNISFNHIRAYVAAEGQQFPDLHWEQGYREGERRTCITLNAADDDWLEQISFNDVHVVYEGGGTQAEAALRELPAIAGEYFEIGPRPAYGLYARQVRGLTLQNVRFEVARPDLRPAVVFDRVNDASINGLTVQGNSEAESALRFAGSRDILVTGARLLSAAPVFLRIEGGASAGITLDGGDLGKAGRPIECAAGADDQAIRLRV